MLLAIYFGHVILLVAKIGDSLSIKRSTLNISIQANPLLSNVPLRCPQIVSMVSLRTGGVEGSEEDNSRREKLLRRAPSKGRREGKSMAAKVMFLRMKSRKISKICTYQACGNFTDLKNVPIQSDPSYLQQKAEGRPCYTSA